MADEAIFAAAAYNRGQWLQELVSPAVQIYFSSEQHTNTVTGFISAALIGDDMEIRKVGVLAGYRRQGIAEALLRAVIISFKTEQPQLVRCLIDVAADNTGALAFYEKSGFVEFARRRKYYAHGADAILMEKILSAM